MMGPSLVIPPSVTSRLGLRRGTTTKLPFHTHPIYTLCKLTIILSLLSILFFILSLPPYGNNSFLWSIILPFFPIVFSIWGLTSWVLKKAIADRDGEAEPKWPSKGWMIGDVVLVVCLLRTWMVGVADIEWKRSGYGSAGVIRNYAVLAVFCCS